MERKISGNLRNGSSAAANQGVRFPYGFPGSLNPYHISLPPRSTTVPNSKPAANEFRTKIKDEVYETQGPETLENEIKAKPKCDVCDRPRSVVTCVACGYRQGNLRVQMQCPTHGRVQFLTDLKECPQCHTENLMEEHSELRRGLALLNA